MGAARGGYTDRDTLGEMDDAGNCHRFRTPRRGTTSYTAYGKPRTEMEATLGCARRIAYSAALETMREMSDGDDGLTREAERDNGILPSLSASSPSNASEVAIRGRSVDSPRSTRPARTGGLYCPGEASSVQQVWGLGAWGKPVWLPVNRGAMSQRAAREPRHAPARAAIDVVGRGTMWPNSVASIRAFTAADGHSNEALATLRCVACSCGANNYKKLPRVKMPHY